MLKYPLISPRYIFLFRTIRNKRRFLDKIFKNLNFFFLKSFMKQKKEKKEDETYLA